MTVSSEIFSLTNYKVALFANRLMSTELRSLSINSLTGAVKSPIKTVKKINKKDPTTPVKPSEANPNLVIWGRISSTLISISDSAWGVRTEVGMGSTFEMVAFEVIWGATPKRSYSSSQIV